MSADHQDRAWEIAEGCHVCFFRTGNQQFPMSAIVRKEEGAIYFLTEAATEKVNEIKDDLTVELTFSNESANDYLFIKGSATITYDPVKVKDLWNQFSAAFWDKPEDPRIRIITVRPIKAEFWDGPGRFVAASKMLFAAISGGKPDLGDHHETTM
ncbi:pyridoxamine 5'-phosphate oxidase family protein [Brucella thiophenivorans]|nr:pyridoxamine 5'-phosphate oxidase family protein [Brucella thiophenivorans]